MRVTGKCLMVCLVAFLLSGNWGVRQACAGQDPRLVTLAAADVFKGISSQQLDAVTALGRIQRLAAGETFIQHGRHTGKIFVLKTGKAKVILTSGKEAAEVGYGTTLGEVELADGKPATATVRMSSAGSAVVIDMTSLREAMLKDPVLGYTVMSNVARKIAGLLRSRQ